MAKKAQIKTKAFQILEKSKSKVERVESFYESTKRNLLRSIIDSKINEIEKLKDKIFELSDFSLETNLNSGLSALSREETECRFKEIMNLEYQLKLLILELKAKHSIYIKYFGGMITNKIIKYYLGEEVAYSKFIKQMPEIIFKEVDMPEFADIILVGSYGFDMSISDSKRNEDLLKSYYDKVHALYFCTYTKKLSLYKVTPSGKLTSPFISKDKLLKLCKSEEIPLRDSEECVLGADLHSLSQKTDTLYIPITQERKTEEIYTYQDESVSNPCLLTDKRLLLSL